MAETVKKKTDKIMLKIGSHKLIKIKLLTIKSEILFFFCFFNCSINENLSG